MRNQNATRAVVAAAALGLILTGCSRTGDDQVAQPSSEVSQVPRPSTQGRAPTSVDAQPTVAPQTVTTVESGPAATPQTEPAPEATPASATESKRPGSGHGLCFDLNTKLSQDALASIGTDSNGGEWRIVGASNNPLSGGCGLDYLLVNGSGFNDATSTSRVLLVGTGKYLGTVEPHELSYTSIAGSTLNSVTVRYRWLRENDAFCCPQGGPTEVTVTLSGDQLTRTGQFPPEQ